ncbi:MAG: discoidin domain-containing protein [Planctomycetaceae bacterium]|nr:discoidin domain-containing protein [Planctomycetaceae bacterium]
MKPLFFFCLFTAIAAVGLAAPPVQEVVITSDSCDVGYEPYRAMDGDAKSMWHTEFRDKIPELPHILTVDLQKEYEITGFSVVPRTDNWNGIIKEYEVYFSNDVKDSGVVVSKGEFPKEQKTQTVKFEKPLKGRYFTIKVLSAHSTGAGYASICELNLFCDAATFKGKKITAEDIFIANELSSLIAGDVNRWSNADAEHRSEYVRLSMDIKNKARFDKIAAETFLPDSLITAEDRDPLDVVLRRTDALTKDLAGNVQPALIEQLEKLKAAAEATPVSEKTPRFTLFVDACKLRRQVAFSNPLLNFKEILFVKKHRATYSHMCDQYYGINLPAGGGIYVMEFKPQQLAKGEAPAVRNIIENVKVENGRLQGQTLDTGSFLSPDLSFDARRIAFAYVECKGDTAQRFHTDPTKGHWHEERCFHIFTADITSDSRIENLKQITDGTWNDFDPCFLPNGRIAFITERRGGYLRCGRACPTFTLFDMNSDGTGMRALSYHETNEWHPSVTNDGRLLYTRWDYPDRFGCVAHQPWISSIDGRDTRQVHGNFTPRENRMDMELDCRSIPNSPKFVATGAPHHGQAFGSLVLVDPRVEDDDGMAPVKRLTPDIAFPETQGGGQVYGAPFPLSEKYYLAVADFSMDANKGFEWHNRDYVRGDYGIYLVDAFGNKELIYRDPEIGCNSPIPLMPRPTPHIAPEMISPNIEEQPYLLPEREKLAQREQGTVLVTDVYQTIRPYPTGISEGKKLKELRIIQLLPMSVPSGGRANHQPHETGFREPTSTDSVVLCRNVWGTVPIEEDGSVHFKVPPRREFQLQVIDDEGLAVQSMRSSIYLHDGETLSCTGCHEQQAAAVKMTSVAAPKAFKREASVIKPSFPDAVNFSYPRLIQPIWDKHCVECHAQKIAEGHKPPVPDLSRKLVPDDKNIGQWYASYKELKPYVFYSYGERFRTIPGSFGARASKLYPLLKAGHYEVKLSDEELQKVALWLDCVSLFYGVYEKEGGKAQLRGEVAFPTLE